MLREVGSRRESVFVAISCQMKKASVCYIKLLDEKSQCLLQ